MENKKRAGRPPRNKKQIQEMKKQSEHFTVFLKRENLTQYKLSKITGIRQQAFSDIKKGKSSLTETTAEEIKKHFPNYRIEWLIGKDEIMTESDLTILRIKEKISAIRSPLKGINMTPAMLWGEPLLNCMGYEYEMKYRDIDETCILKSRGIKHEVTISKLNDCLSEIAEYADFKLKKLISTENE